jgi:hypothetical protein
MAINIISPATFTTSILIGDPAFTNNAGHDSIPLLTRRNGSPVSAAIEIQSTDSALLVSRMTTTQMNAIPNPTNGMLIYNTTANQLFSYTAGIWVGVAGGGTGTVTGPGVSVAGDIAIFADTTGKVIADSGVDIIRVPVLQSLLKHNLLDKNSPILEVTLATGNEIGNLSHIRFINDAGLIFVDTLMPVEFITNDFGPSSQVCSLFTGDLPSSSTTPSALVELQSTTGALLLSRMNTAQQNALLVPSGSAGMILFNTDTDTLNFYNGTSWIASATGTGTTWVDAFVTPAVMAANTSYVADSASLLTFTLPTTCPFGTMFNVTGKGTGGWKIAQNAGQQINLGNTATTSGATGFLASTNTFDSVTLVCVAANTEFVVYSCIGNITIN